jgi:hypothetical protein
VRFVAQEAPDPRKKCVLVPVFSIAKLWGSSNINWTFFIKVINNSF